MNRNLQHRLRSPTTAALTRYQANQCAQCLVNRIGVRKVLAHVRRDNHGPFFEFEMLNNGCPVHLADSDRVTTLICAVVFSTHAA